MLDSLRSIDVLTLKSLRGTPKYFSPELFQGFSGTTAEIKYNPMKADIYSLGIIVIELLLGKESAQAISSLQVSSHFLYRNEIKKIKSELLSRLKQQRLAKKLVGIILSMVRFIPEERQSPLELCLDLIETHKFSYLNFLPENNPVLFNQLIRKLKEREITEQPLMNSTVLKTINEEHYGF